MGVVSGEVSSCTWGLGAFPVFGLFPSVWLAVCLCVCVCVCVSWAFLYSAIALVRL